MLTILQMTTFIQVGEAFSKDLILFESHGHHCYFGSIAQTHRFRAQSARGGPLRAVSTADRRLEHDETLRR